MLGLGLGLRLQNVGLGLGLEGYGLGLGGCGLCLEGCGLVNIAVIQNATVFSNTCAQIHTQRRNCTDDNTTCTLCLITVVC